MTPGFWIPPVVLAGRCVFLWLAARLERLIPALDEPPTTATVDSALTVTGPAPTVCSFFPIPTARTITMAIVDKAKNDATRAKGKIKETIGKVTGDDNLKAKGKADRMKGDLKQAGEKVKDAFKK